MTGRNYPDDWEERRREVLHQHLYRCVNCQQANRELEVHHIVPVGQGGSHQRPNLVPLCQQCHLAAHGEAMAPRVRWHTNGRLSDTEFDHHLSLWKGIRDELGVPRYDPQEEAIYVPLADVEEIPERLQT